MFIFDRLSAMFRGKKSHSPSEKRSAPRYVDGKCTYFFTILGRCLETRIVDISTKGVRISIEAELPENVRGELLITIREKTLYIPLRFSWKRKSQKHYEYGAQFLPLTPACKSLVREYIHLGQLPLSMTQ